MYSVAAIWVNNLVARVGDVCIAVVNTLGAVIGR